MATCCGRRCQIVFLIITIITDILDILCDWLFFIDIWRLEPGLVYGPPSSAIKFTVLFISIFSSFLLFFEIINSMKAAHSEKAYVNADKLLLVTVWFADLPEIIVSTIIAACREDPVSIFQLTKASVVLVGLAYKVIVFVCGYFNKNKAERIRRRWLIFLTLGFILNAAGSTAIFILTQTNRLENGGVSLTVPQTAFTPVYNNERYFKNVDIFFNHQTFTSTTTGTNYVRLISLNEIRSAGPNTKFYFNYEYEDSGDQIRMAFWNKKDNEEWKSGPCYTINKTTNEIQMDSNCISSSTESIFITFQFAGPEPVFHTLIIGDIKYNLKIKKANNDCTDDTGSQILHYFRTETQHGGYLNNTQFYKSKNMEDIKKVWKTGWLNCESSSSVAPNKDTNLETLCSRT